MKQLYAELMKLEKKLRQQIKNQGSHRAGPESYRQGYIDALRYVREAMEEEGLDGD